MSRDTNEGSMPETRRSEEASPSHTADQSEHDRDETYNASGPTRKRSWFGSLRDVLGRSSPQARPTGSVASNEPSKTAHESAVDEAPLRDTRQSIDDAVTTTSLVVVNGSELRHILGSKGAIASLRNHLPHHGPKTHHSKRSSICSIASGPLPETLASDRISSPEDQDNAATHSRKSSLTHSLVGSIRGLGRKSLALRPTPKQQIPSPEEQAESVALPSSPINIPTMAPALELDLGPTGFMSPLLASSSPPKRESLVPVPFKLEDPANITGLPEEHRNYFPPSLGVPRDAVTRSDILKVRDYFTIKSASPPAACPATPMPGTNFTLDLDGANSEHSARSQVFERSVTPCGLQQYRELRTMRSLSAMAEACAVTRARDEAENEVDSMNPDSSDLALDHDGAHAALKHLTSDGVSSRQTDERTSDIRALSDIPGINESTCSLSESLKVHPTSESIASSPCRDASSSSTLPRCPSYMSRLSRQTAIEPTGSPPKIGSLDGSILSQKKPPGRNKAHSDGPPSPGRYTTLPLRPKASLDIHRIFSPLAWADEPLISSYSFTLGQKSFDGAVEGHTTKHGLDAEPEEQTYPAGSSMLTPSSLEASTTTRSMMTHFIEDIDAHIEDQACIEHSELFDRVGDNADLSSLTSTPAESERSSSKDDLAPFEATTIPALYAKIPSPHKGSPDSPSSRTTYMTGLGDSADYKFTLENWLKTSASNAEEAGNEPCTPKRRGFDSSIDSTGAEYHVTNEFVPGIEATPQANFLPLMSRAGSAPSDSKVKTGEVLHSETDLASHGSCDGVSFNQESAGDVPVNSATDIRPVHSMLGCGIDIDANAFAFADLENAYASSSAGSPLKEAAPSTAEDVHSGSEESLPMSMEEAIVHHNHFANNLHDLVGADSYTFVPVLSSPVRGIAAFEEKLGETTPLGKSAEVLTVHTGADTTELSSGDSYHLSRAKSPDTLDNILPLFSSPSSGYRADESSVSPASEPEYKAPMLSRCHAGNRQPYGEAVRQGSKTLAGHIGTAPRSADP